MGFVLLAARLIIALVFAVAGVAKLLDRPGTRQGVAGFGVPAALVNPLGFALPLAELAVAAALVPTGSAWWGAVGAVVLLLLFMGGIGINLARGNTPDCHCFGQLHSEPIGSSTLIRNGVLVLGAVLIVAQGPGHAGRSLFDSLGRLVPAGDTGVALVALAAGLLAALLVFLLRLFQENRRLLTTVEAREAAAPAPASDGADRNGHAVIALQGQLPKRPAGQDRTTLGEPAPDVTFLDMYGRTQSLADFRGWDTMVVFWDSNAPDCKRILPGLKGLEARPPRAVPRLLLVVQASADTNQTVDLRSPVVIDRDGNVARAFGVDSTPTAILVDARGDIASDLAAGPDEVLALATGQRHHARGVVRWAGLEFEASRDVHPPRPETESVAEKAAELARECGARVVAEIGTGGGAIATFLARELPEARVYAVDVSPEAIAMARRNLERHGVTARVELLSGNLLEPLPERPDLIVATLPYLSDEMMASAEHRLRFEPRVALYGGPTGLELYAQMFRQMAERDWIVPLVVEIWPEQSEPMQELLRSSFPSGEVEILPTYTGAARLAVCVPEGAAGRRGASPRLLARPTDPDGALLAGTDVRRS